MGLSKMHFEKIAEILAKNKVGSDLLTDFVDYFRSENKNFKPTKFINRIKEIEQQQPEIKENQITKYMAWVKITEQKAVDEEISPSGFMPESHIQKIENSDINKLAQQFEDLSVGMGEEMGEVEFIALTDQNNKILPEAWFFNAQRTEIRPEQRIDQAKIRDFFILRFHKLPENDKYYFSEWQERFANGEAWATSCMDSESLKAWQQISSTIKRPEERETRAEIREPINKVLEKCK